MSTKDDTSSLFKIDDADSRLVYAGNWFTGGVAGEWDSTTHGTRTKGASVTFVFNGTFVEAYGTVDSTGTKISYTLDSETHPITLSPVERPEYIHQLFQETNLTLGVHTLVITCIEDGSTLWLDYLDFFGHLGPPGPPASSLGAAAPTASSSTSIPPGIIALAVIGGVLCLLGGILIGIYFFRRHWHRVGLIKPTNDANAQRKDLDTIPDYKPYSIETLRIKLLGAQSRTNVGAVTAPPQSSTLFTSVILSLGAPSSSSGATNRV